MEQVSATGSYATMIGQLRLLTGVFPGISASNHRCMNTGLFVYKLKRKLKQITDGTSKTIAVGEVKGEDTSDGDNIWSRGISWWQHDEKYRQCAEYASWYDRLLKPYSECQYGPCWNGAFGSNHAGGGHFCFADGHVTFISDNIDTDSYEALATYAGNESPPLSSF